jgi:hypothetical protein
VIASSSTALANLAYLIGAVVVAVIGGLIVWMRHRQPKSVDANMASFRRGLNALAPDIRASSPAQPGRPEQFRIRPVRAGMAHARSGPERSADRESAPGLPSDVEDDYDADLRAERSPEAGNSGDGVGGVDG